MDMSEYVKQTRKALTREQLGNLQFIYTAKEQKHGALLLSWKKHVIEENIKVSPILNQSAIFYRKNTAFLPPVSVVEVIKSVLCVCVCVCLSALPRLNHLTYRQKI